MLELGWTRALLRGRVQGGGEPLDKLGAVGRLEVAEDGADRTHWIDGEVAVRGADVAAVVGVPVVVPRKVVDVSCCAVSPSVGKMSRGNTHRNRTFAERSRYVQLVQEPTILDDGVGQHNARHENVAKGERC